MATWRPAVSGTLYDIFYSSLSFHRPWHAFKNLAFYKNWGTALLTQEPHFTKLLGGCTCECRAFLSVKCSVRRVLLSVMGIQNVPPTLSTFLVLTNSLKCQIWLQSCTASLTLQIHCYRLSVQFYCWCETAHSLWKTERHNNLVYV